MRVLVLGGSGMLGHKLVQRFSRQFDTWTTLRSASAEYRASGLFAPERTIGEVDAGRFDTVAHALAQVRPDAVINCIGIVKQSTAGEDPISAISINALFPQLLARECRQCRARLIHISTDCVFSGRKGTYTEDDPSDAEDLYGRTKCLGEVSGEGALTLRTSIIGRELKGKNGLLEWLLASRGRVRGYTHAIFSGLTTLALAAVITDVLQQFPTLSGVLHVSADPISKCDLLCLARDQYQLPVEIEPYPDLKIDRSLDSTRFRTLTGLAPPSWRTMITAMKQDESPYDQWRNALCTSKASVS